MIKLGQLLGAIGIVGVLGLGQVKAAVLHEGFDTFPPPGWTIINESSPIGTTDWFQGVPGIFPAQAGAADSYIAANFQAADIGGNIRDWLLTPTVALHNGDELSFYTRTETGSIVGDQLEVRLCLNGPCNTTAGFTQVLIPLFTVPDAWTQMVYQFSGLGSFDTGRVAFLYRVDDTSSNGDYIGIDSVDINSAVAVREPSTLTVVALGLAILGSRLRRAVAR